jgi:hypothetical protein
MKGIILKDVGNLSTNMLEKLKTLPGVTIFHIGAEIDIGITVPNSRARSTREELDIFSKVKKIYEILLE